MFMYTTMTRGKVLRLIARGWEASSLLDGELFYRDCSHFEITFVRYGYFCGICGFGYNQGESC